MGGGERIIFDALFKRILFKVWHNDLNSKAGNDENTSHDKNDISSSLQENIQSLRNTLGYNPDVILRELIIGNELGLKAILVYISGMVNNSIVNENIIKPLMGMHIPEQQHQISGNAIMGYLKSNIITLGQLNEVKSFEDSVNHILSGSSVLFIEGLSITLVMDTVGWEQRKIEESLTEVSVRGSQEAFIENLHSNIVLLRKKIRSPNFTIEMMVLGKHSKTKVCIAYLKDIVNPQLVEEVRARLSKINIDAILESGYIEQYIEDAPLSIFSTIGNSEKPDIVVAKMLEGRVAIIVDGTPFVLTVPKLLIEYFQNAEDYYSRPFYASIIRIIRTIGFAVSIIAPGFYVALTTFHQELIPTPLLLSMAASREGTPFPALAEVILTGILYEILREAGIRLPRPVGTSISIVGALVIGQAAVQAGLITAPMVIVTGVVAISSFVISPLIDVVVVLRIIITLLAGFFGFFGINAGLIIILIHLCSLRSFGTPFFAPIAPLTLKDLKDTFIRAPLWSLQSRPSSITGKDSQRQAAGLKPKPPKQSK